MIEKTKQGYGKSTGYVRRIDDLGRIVIPKEIRRQLFGIGSDFVGQPMEIFIEDDMVILKRYKGE